MQALIIEVKQHWLLVHLQQWQNHGSSMKNTYYLLFEDLSLNQKQKWFDIWIQHIKTDGKQSIPTVHMLTHTRNYFPTYFYSNDKMVVQVTKRHIILCWMIFHSTKSKNDLIIGFSTSKQLIHMLTHTRNFCPTNFTAVTKWWFT